MSRFSLHDLEAIIISRQDDTAKKSYTKSLLDLGVVHCGKKFGEEAVEFAMASAQMDNVSMKSEAADVLYHLLVALQAARIPLQDILDELERRTKMSGHEEKAKRV